LQLLFRQLFASDISSFFAVDLIITAIVLLIFFTNETERYHMSNRWVYIFATLFIGPSFALPLFLYFREERIETLGPGKSTDHLIQ
jgi:hypothetical protein